jgi:hypothetical protein
MRKAKFSKRNQPNVICRVCGKRSTQEASCGTGHLCGPCADIAGKENEHSDEGHQESFRECPRCFPSGPYKGLL